MSRRDLFYDDRTFLTFDDVCLVNGLSEVESRSNVDLKSNLPKGHSLGLPIFTAAMDTITSEEMAEAILSKGGGIFHHRNQTINERCSLLSSQKEIESGINGVAVGLGVTEDEVKSLIENGADLIGIEVAHAYHVKVAECVKRIGPVCEKNNVLLMVGNFSSVESGKWLEQETGNLVDIIKVSQGGGSCCTTRIVTGIGKPTLQAVMDLECSDVDYHIIADGGIKSSGDLAKAVGAGACAGMCGSLLSGTDEAPGEIIEESNGKKFKKFRGMASQEAKNDAQNLMGHQNIRNVEGVSTLTPYKGSVKKVLSQIRDGLQSSVSCCGFDNLEDFKNQSQFVRVSDASIMESQPHALNNKE